jgi:hypothetical protein
MRRVVQSVTFVRLGLMILAVLSVSFVGEAGMAAAASSPRVHENPPLSGKQWLLYWFWEGENQKGPCALLFNANRTLVGDSDGNCSTTKGSWQLSGNTLSFSLRHSCDSQWTATYDSSNGEFANGSMEAMGPSCGGDEGTFWLAPAGRIDSITFDGTASAPSIEITGHGLGNEPTAEAAACSATGDDFVGGEFYLADLSGGDWFAGQPGNCIGLFVSSYTHNQIDYTFGSYYDTAPYEFVLNVGDQLTLAANGKSVVAYVDGFSGSDANGSPLAAVESPAFM